MSGVLESVVSLTMLSGPQLEMVDLVLDDARLAGAPVELRQAAAASRTVDTEYRRGRPPTSTVAFELDAAASALLAGAAFDAKALTRLAAAERAETEAGVAQVAVAALRSAVLARVPAVLRAHRDTVLAEVLRPLLAEQVTRYAALAEVAAGLDPSDVDSVMTASDAARSAYMDISVLARDYADLREAQRVVLDGDAGQRGTHERAWARGLAEVSAPRALPEDPRAHLVAVMASGAAWMPTLAEMDAAGVGSTAPVKVSQPGREEPGGIYVPKAPDVLVPTGEPAHRGTRSDAAARPGPNTLDRLAAAATAHQ